MIDIFSTGKKWYDEKRKQLDKSIEIEGLDGWTRFISAFHGVNGEKQRPAKYKRIGNVIWVITPPVTGSSLSITLPFKKST